MGKSYSACMAEAPVFIETFVFATFRRVSFFYILKESKLARMKNIQDKK